MAGAQGSDRNARNDTTTETTVSYPMLETTVSYPMLETTVSYPLWCHNLLLPAVVSQPPSTRCGVSNPLLPAVVLKPVYYPLWC